MKWPPSRRPLDGAIVRLEPIEPSHRAELTAAAREPETWTWIDRRIPGDAAAFDAWFDARVEALRGGSEFCYVARRLASGEVIGSSSYLNVRGEHDGLEIGWTWLHPSAWRSGANLDAKLLMLDHAFTELGAMRVEFKTDARNERSRAALAVLPATFEGVFRRHMRVPLVGVRDSAYYAIVDHEWPEAREKLAARLARGAESPVRA